MSKKENHFTEELITEEVKEEPVIEEVKEEKVVEEPVKEVRHSGTITMH